MDKPLVLLAVNIANQIVTHSQVTTEHIAQEVVELVKKIIQDTNLEE